MKRAAIAGIPIPPNVVAYIGRELLAGLRLAHDSARAADGSRLEVVHRDLCPANLLLSKNGEVKVSDFGVARALRDADSTHTRTVAGHAGYMAPEQALALPIDEKCDPFAVGVILWGALVCGRPLFHRGSEGPTLVAVLSAEIEPPTHVRPGLDPQWDRLIAHALDREVMQRVDSASAMSAELAALADAKVPAAGSLAPSSRGCSPSPSPGRSLSAARRAPRPRTPSSRRRSKERGRWFERGHPRPPRAAPTPSSTYPPVATFAPGLRDHSLHDPAYSLAPSNPTTASARRSWHAVTPGTAVRDRLVRRRSECAIPREQRVSREHAPAREVSRERGAHGARDVPCTRNSIGSTSPRNRSPARASSKTPLE